MFPVLTLGFLCFIFFNSAQDGVASGARSMRVVTFLQSLANTLHVPITVSEFAVRKLAHFTEFFILGILLCVNIRLVTANWWARIFVPLFFGLLIPVLDETLQLFSPGRSSEVRDILIDFSGVLVGILVSTPIIARISDRKKKK